MLMGLPGSGKTTLAKKLEKLTGAERLSSDDYRLRMFPDPTFTQEEHDNLYRILDHNVDHLLATGKSVIYDANLNRRMHREEKYQLAKKHNARVVLWWLKTPDDLSKRRRIDDQNHILLPKDTTPEQLFERVAGVFEAPEADEPCYIFDGTHVTDERVEAALSEQEDA